MNVRIMRGVGGGSRGGDGGGGVVASCGAMKILCRLCLLVLLVCHGCDSALFSNKGMEGTNSDERLARSFLRQYNRQASEACNRFMTSSWNYNTNATVFNKRAMLTRQLEWTQFHQLAWREATKFAWRNFSDPAVRRQFSYLTVLGSSALEKDDLDELNGLVLQMRNSYSRARICRFDPSAPGASAVGINNNPDYDDDGDDCAKVLPFEPDIRRLMANSRNPDELRHLWQEWRDAAGRPNRDRFERFVELTNRAARLNGFEDAGEFWRSKYEMEDIREQIDELWGQLRPLYEQLHAYVRRKLRERYGEDVVPQEGPIPAHLLGDMWAQSWTNILDLTVPYPGRSGFDVTGAMRRQGYTPVRIFQEADRFYTSLGLEPMPVDFWRNSLFQKPQDRPVICHASAWDFCNGRDYRVKKCTDVDMENLLTAHHEVGHIQYDMRYRAQPIVFREGANPGFHEAVADAMTLSATSPEHLQAIGLLGAIDESYESDINYLFAIALDKIAFLPFGYLVDQWRWEVFNGTTDPSDYNERWWQLRQLHQGVSPPVVRDEDDFDPGAKFHIPANIPYARFFVSAVLQFQMHKELCDATGRGQPLHKCDIFRSREAGERLSDMLSLGRSRPWNEALSVLTQGRTSRMDAAPLVQYFSPLLTWLQSQNRDQVVGWRESEALVLGAQRLAAPSTLLVVIIVLAILLFLVIFIIMFFVLRNKSKDKNDRRPLVHAWAPQPPPPQHHHHHHHQDSLLHTTSFIRSRF
ncbi:angiotensin-converting enzyme-like isoform X2 [Oratosquilla oratoria]|uniref:angiotensin-converting enzyme-like isoform X2 n=1 Tax=Oratosquilla oratoria TaxID=337810 RepID=UPI003F765126